MESCPFKQPSQSEKGGKREKKRRYCEEGGGVACVCKCSFMAFESGGVTSWEAPDELRNGVSLLISKLKHVPR